MSIELGRDICGNVGTALQREWLVTNGLGGFACGTVAGALTRRYHGWLMAATTPPTGRTLLCPKIDETLTIGGRAYPLYTNIWNTGVEAPNACDHLVAFRLVRGLPEWEFEFEGLRILRRIGMFADRNATWVQWEMIRPPGPIASPARLNLRCFANHRDYHQLLSARNRAFEVKSTADGVESRAEGSEASTFFRIASSAGNPAWQLENTWYCNFCLPVEHRRGFDFKEDHLCLGACTVELEAGLITATIATESIAPDDAVHVALEAHKSDIVQTPATPRRAGALAPETAAAVTQLEFAAAQFIVKRPDSSASAAERANGHTIIAGYPWFTDWGRDTMISLPGLTLATGRLDIARQVLLTWSRYVDRGMIPNRFPDAGAAPEYHTADATLWFVWAIDQYVRASDDQATLTTLYPIVREILDHHRRGTRHHIHMTEDGLLFAGEPGVNLTWMDAKVGDQVITPRIGKPIEINALWHHALCTAARFAKRLDQPDQEWRSLAAQTASAFGRFHNPARGSCFDVLDGPDGNDATLRPNQILAVALDDCPLSETARRAAVAACEKHLLTPVGLRSLGPAEPGYVGQYHGGPAERDAVYHQGTVWGWLLGPFVIAHYRLYHNATRAREFLQPMLTSLSAGCVGSLSEIFDGDAPHEPHGCFAQAWSVAETLRAWRFTQEGEPLSRTSAMR